MDTMKLSKMIVRNFKAINHEEVELGDYNIIIGKNDVGKSSLLEAIDMLLNFDTPDKSDFHMFDEGNTITLHGEFQEAPDTLTENLSEDYQDGGDLSITVRYEFSGGRQPDRIEINSEELDQGAIIEGDEELSMSDSRTYIKEQLGDTVPVFADRNSDEETELKRGSWLSKLMNPVFNSDDIEDLKEDIRSEIRTESHDIEEKLDSFSEQHPSIYDAKIDVGDIDLSKSVTPAVKVKDTYIEDEWMSLSGRGTGVGNQFILSMMKAYAESQIGDGYCVLFEEPENSLHPSAVREMGGALREIAQQGNQVLLTTHSQSLINTHENGAMIVATNDDGVARFDNVESEGFEALEEIGAKNSDILQSDFVLYTEGGSDAEVVQVICKNEFDDWNSRNVTIQPAGGSNMERQLENMQEINRNSAILIDSDRGEEGGGVGEQTRILRETAERIGIEYWILNRRELENYFHPQAIESVLDTSEDINLDRFDPADDILKNEHGYNDGAGKVVNARRIAEKMYEEGLDDEFADLKTCVYEAFQDT
jgi:putative ATP-dependent endonuclease of OLD family